MNPTQETRPAAPGPTPAAPATPAAAPSKTASLRGLPLAEQEAALAPADAGPPVQMKPAVQRKPGKDAASDRAANPENAADWSAAYGAEKNGQRTISTHVGWSYDTYKGGLGRVEATSAGGLQANAYGHTRSGANKGQVMTADITRPTLLSIFTGMKADFDNEPDAKKKKELDGYIDDMVGYLNEAFKAMKVDTVEARAAYLSHAFIESDQFRRFTETQKATQNYERDPSKVTLDTGYLKGLGDAEIAQDAEHAKDPTKPKGANFYRPGGSVNPNGNYEFLGRGPIQVTHKAQYVETIAMLEHMAEQWLADAAKETDATKKAEDEKLGKKCAEAATAVKKDPSAAARPEYSLLFSAATMKRAGGDVSSGDVKPGQTWNGVDGASGWVAGGKQDPKSAQGKALIEKGNVYAKAVPILQAQAAAQPPAQQPAQQPPGQQPPAQQAQPPAGKQAEADAPGGGSNVIEGVDGTPEGLERASTIA
ncbi:MAG: hypothetical protein U1F43_35160 [Myxococcota bacterium]